MNIALTVNGRAHRLDLEPRRVLADVLREDCGLTGTHLGCEHGVCGACTVLVDGEAVRSCLLLAVQCDGRSVRTVEGLAGPDGEPHPLQRAFSAEHALQCGFCTPGFLMLAAGALESDPTIAADPERLRELLTSNLCRCTGYEPIRRAIQRALLQDTRKPPERSQTGSTAAIRPASPDQL
ncbi:MAG: 2Fe-2S cluster binding protein [Sphaerisporangium sp.]|jgi:carbon-monoxide dehydrogenase small subunit|nr:2Fe-2S cluster binding protein [Sphaerisporangium sp.]